ncbi:MAG: hypothetical protein ACI854_001032 [Arenicella sp.]|jgi:hypothetical protein
MILNQTITNNLNSIRCFEGARIGKQLNVSANELGYRLIGLYCNTDGLQTKHLITEFMTQASVVWLRKLLTRDIRTIASYEEALLRWMIISVCPRLTMILNKTTSITEHRPATVGFD